jgi:hypothetical protein
MRVRHTKPAYSTDEHRPDRKVRNEINEATMMGPVARERRLRKVLQRKWNS